MRNKQHPMAPEGQTIEAIVWLDACTSDGWSVDPEEVKVMTCMTVGRVVHEDDRQLVVAGTFGISEGDEQTNCRIAIPKGWVQSRLQLIARS